MIAADRPRRRHILLAIHGIRTTATWAERVKVLVEEGTEIEVRPIRYGYFDTLRFLSPFVTRSRPIMRIAREIRSIRIKEPEARISVIAHSFGTYAIARILKEHPDIELHRLLLCGAIVPLDFPWDAVRRQLDDHPVNDCGWYDVWPVVAATATLGFGASGVWGFGSAIVRDRFFPFRHSGFFSDDVVRDFWKPYFAAGTVARHAFEQQRPQPAFWRLHLPRVRRWLVVVLAAAVLYGVGIPRRLLPPPLEAWLERRENLSPDRALEFARAHLGASVTGAVPFRNKGEQAQYILIRGHESTALLKGTGNSFEAISADVSCKDDACEVVDVDGDGVKEIFTSYGDRGTQLWSVSVAIYDTRSGWISGCGAEGMAGNDPTLRPVCSSNVDEKPGVREWLFAKLEEITGRDEELTGMHALAREWVEQNGYDVVSGDLKITEHAGALLRGPWSTFGCAVSDGPLEWYAVFKGPLLGYDRDRNVHFVVYVPFDPNPRLGLISGQDHLWISGAAPGLLAYHKRDHTLELIPEEAEATPVPLGAKRLEAGDFTTLSVAGKTVYLNDVRLDWPSVIDPEREFATASTTCAGGGSLHVEDDG